MPNLQKFHFDVFGLKNDKPKNLIKREGKVLR